MKSPVGHRTAKTERTDLQMNPSELTEKVKSFLYEHGAKLVGIGDMRGVANSSYMSGISVTIPLPAHLIHDLQTAPTREYYETYYVMNRKLNEIVTGGECFLKELGYDAYAQTTDRVVVNEHRISKIPHKTVATRAGVG